MRNSTACIECRRAKRRCIRQGQSQACISCQHRQLECGGKLHRNHMGPRILVSRSNDTAISHRQLSQSHESQTARNPNLSNGTAIELVDLYLDRFDGRPHTIFHPATLRSAVRNRTLNTALLYGICALGCKFSGNPETRDQGLFLAAESKRLLQADISNVCLENIQTCILIAMLSVGHGDSSSETLFFRTYTAQIARTWVLWRPAADSYDQESLLPWLRL